MNVTAYIRKSKDKDKATVYMRLRDRETDMKAATELTINPAYWDVKRQACKNRVMLITEQERQRFNNAVIDLKRLIDKEYYVGANHEWLKKLIFVFHHPNAYKMVDNKTQEVQLTVLIEQYIEAKDFDKRQAVTVRGIKHKIERFETFRNMVKKQSDYRLTIDTIIANDLWDFHDYLVHEHEYAKKYAYLYRQFDKSLTEARRSQNTLHNVFSKLRTVVKWCIRKGITRNNPFERFEMPKALYGEPWYLTLEERDKLIALDLSAEPHLAVFRDMFVFQCFVGCRFGDLIALAPENVVDGVLQYIPTKTRNHNARTVRVPLTERALHIYEQFKDKGTMALFPRYGVAEFNKGIRKVMTIAGLDRKVTVINPLTRQQEMHPICEIATSHIARKTFIGNLYKQVKDPNLISSMSGHVEGSRAFARYRTIDDDMKKELIEFIR